jgi:hypothetical protein
VHPIGSYCKDISRCTVNRTLNLPIKSPTLHLTVLNHLLYCSQLMVHDNPSSSLVYGWNPNSRPLTPSLISISAFHYLSELNVLFWLERIYIYIYIALPRPTDDVQNSRLIGLKSNAKHAEATRREDWKTKVYFCVRQVIISKTKRHTEK